MPAGRRQHPTIHDLREATGYSRATISQAFAGSAKVDPQTRLKILEAAKRLGYTPRLGMVAPKPRRTGRYGLLIPHLENPYYAEMVQSLDLELRRSGRMIVLALHHYDVSTIEDLVRHWVCGETDGVILDPPDLRQAPRVLDYLRSRHFPVVFLHGTPSDTFSLVTHARGPSYARAMHQLWRLGHRRIAYIGIQHRTARQTESFVAYRTLLTRQGVPLEESYLHFGRNAAATGLEALAQFARSQPRPTAVVCFNDILACGVAKAAGSLGLSIPQDLSLIGGDDIPEASRIGLTTVRVDRDGMARETRRLLELQQQGRPTPREVVPIPTELIMRESVDAPPSC